MTDVVARLGAKIAAPPRRSSTSAAGRPTPVTLEQRVVDVADVDGAGACTLRPDADGDPIPAYNLSGRALEDDLAVWVLRADGVLFVLGDVAPAVILTASDGSRWTLGVSTTGTLTTSPVAGG